MEKQTRACPKCKRTLRNDKFYKRAGPAAKKEGRLGQPYGYCKVCVRSKMTDTPYQYFSTLMHRVRRRSRYKGMSYDIDKDYLVEIYKKQKGICAVSDTPMTMTRGKGDIYENMSIDRIDSAIGYIRGNVRLVCRAVNTMKADMTDEQTVIWCRKISKGLDDH